MILESIGNAEFQESKGDNMFNIRKGIFETNSSSTHSICVSKNNDYKIPSSLKFEVGEYGWQNEFLYDSEELASYLYTAIYEVYENREIEDFKNYIYEVLGKHDCEAEFVEPEVGEWGLKEGYIDHCYETKDFLEAVRHSEKRLLRFLFSPESFILLGNNNDETYSINVSNTDFSQVEEFYKSN
jgi:hypothetical protein